MTQRFDEINGSRSTGGTFDAPTASAQFKARGYDSEVQVYAATLLNTAAIYTHPSGFILYRQEPQITEIGSGHYSVTVSYEKKNILDWRFSGTVGGGTLHITQSKKLAARHVSPASGAVAIGTVGEPYRIGHEGDTLQGTEAVIPVGRYSFTVSNPSGVVTIPYTLSLYNKIAHTNSVAWGAFPAGTCLYFQADFSDGRDAPAEVTHVIMYSANAIDQKIRDIVGIDKKGHEYLDITYEEEVEGGEATRLARHVHIHKLYDESNFASFLGFTPT